MSADEWYLKKGKAQAKIIIANWLALLKKKQEIGFTGLCVAGEMEVFFDNKKIKELFSYEAAIGRQFSFDMCTLCIYDVNRLDEKKIVKLSKYHGHEIFRDMAFKTIEPHSLNQ